jgi:hypothetical protein
LVLRPAVQLPTDATLEILALRHPHIQSGS